VGTVVQMTHRDRRSRRPITAAATTVLLGVLLAGCGSATAGAGADTSGRVPTAGGRPTQAAVQDPDAPTGWGPTEGELARAEHLVSGMSVAQQAASVLMPGFWGFSATAPSAAEAAANQEMHGSRTAVEAVQEHGYGALFLRPEVISDADQVAELVGPLQDAAEQADGLPALISIDQEGGTVQRLAVGVDTVPSAAWVGSTGDPSYARQVALDNGRSLVALGITMVMAPVADVDPDGLSAMGSRTYSGDPAVASRMVTATVDGYLDAGIIPVVKHFPGLGSVVGDSHVSLPVQHKSLAQLQETDLRPFVAAIQAGAPVVMTGHVAVQALDPGVPGSLSPEVVQGLLRDELGFEGVAVTDSQGMGPVNEPYGSGEGAVLSLLAGNDLVLNSPEPLQALAAVERAVADGRLPAGRLAEAATRVLALRIYEQRLAAAKGPAVRPGG